MKESFNKSVDGQRLQNYMEYFNNYYGADFRPGQGLDEITDMISRYSLSGTWVDLGGGTSTFIWLPAFEEITEAHSIDKYIESTYIHEHVRAMRPSGCYAHILNRYGRSACEMNRIPITYSQIDLLNDFVAEKKFNNVSQFGLLGLCKTKHEYIRQLEMLTDFMDCKSVFLGANWQFSTVYAETKGFTNAYLDMTLIAEAVIKKKWTLLHLQQITIVDDPYYDSILIYAFTK